MAGSDVNPIGPTPNFGANSPAPDPTGELNSIGNQMWLATFFLFNQSGYKADQASFGMAMEAIQNFIAYCNKNPSVVNADPYLQKLWNLLEAKDGDNPQSLADLANTYAQSGFSYAGLKAFSNFVENPQGDPLNIYDAFAGVLDQWGSNEGGYKSNAPSGLSLNDLYNLTHDLQETPPNYQQFLISVYNIDQALKNAPQPLDGVCQSLYNLINMPLASMAAGDTLAALADPTGKNAGSLQIIMQGNPTFQSSWSDLFKQCSQMEFPQ